MYTELSGTALDIAVVIYSQFSRSSERNGQRPHESVSGMHASVESEILIPSHGIGLGFAWGRRAEPKIFLINSLIKNLKLVLTLPCTYIGVVVLIFANHYHFIEVN